MTFFHEETKGYEWGKSKGGGTSDTEQYRAGGLRIVRRLVQAWENGARYWNLVPLVNAIATKQLVFEALLCKFQYLCFNTNMLVLNTGKL
jgi:hypothetical protein